MEKEIIRINWNLKDKDFPALREYLILKFITQRVDELFVNINGVDMYFKRTPIKEGYKFGCIYFWVTSDPEECDPKWGGDHCYYGEGHDVVEIGINLYKMVFSPIMRKMIEDHDNNMSIQKIWELDLPEYSGGCNHDSVTYGELSNGEMTAFCTRCGKDLTR